MRAVAGTILMMGLLARAFSAPVDIDVDKKGGQRVSTKEILNLEQQLKAQAGEDKKFYPNDMLKEPSFVPPQGKVDGLETDKPGDKDLQQAAQPGGISPPGSSKQLNEEGADHQAIKDQVGNHRGETTDENDAEAIPSQFDLAEQDEIEAEKRRDHSILDALDKELMNERAAGIVGDDKNARVYMGEDGMVGEEPFAVNDVGRPEAEVDEDSEEEALFMQNVMEALRDRPELLQQFLQAGRLEDEAANDVIVPQSEEEADREAVVRAELMEETGNRGLGWTPDNFVSSQLLAAERLREKGEARNPVVEKDNDENELSQQGLPYMEDYQKYSGDAGARVVKKSYNPYRLRPDSSEEEEDEESKESHSSESKEKFNQLRNKGVKGSEEDTSEDKSDESKEEHESESKSSEEEQKRIDMSQHLVM